MRHQFSSTILAIILVIPAVVQAATPALLELKTDKIVYQGKLVGRGQNYCWLMGRDGRLDLIDLKNVKSFRKINPQFRSYTPGDLRSRLLQEFGRDFEVSGTRHYLVCAPRGEAKKYAEIFEDVYRTFYLHFSVRGFKVKEPDFPLVAIVFPHRKEFDDYCRKDKIAFGQNLRGYYLSKTNRVAMYDSRAKSSTSMNRPEKIQRDNLFSTIDRHSSYGAVGSLRGSLKDTVIHEATHQVAFNVGLHSRIGQNPKWIVEGLATVFEAPGIRDSSQHQSVAARINRERFIWFRNFSKSRRKPKSLAAFVSSDGLFKSDTLDAYSQAWALSFYLIETRPREYAGYLKAIATRDPFRRYQPEDRLDDFKKAFGSHLDLLEADFLRYLERIK